MSAGSGLNETALYGIVTTIYFGIFMYRYNQGQIATDKRAMFNITMVFMFAQPLCRILGGTNGLVAFAGLCMSSIILLPSPQQDRKDEEKMKNETPKESSKKSREKKQRKPKND